MALITLSQLKTHLSITNATSDAKLPVFIAAAEAFIKSYASRDIFEAQDVTEYHDGGRANIMITREYPINSITELRIDSDHLFTDASTLIDPADYAVQDDAACIVLHNRTFPAGYRNIKVIYNAGYSPVPGDLTLVALWLAEWYYLNNERRDMGRNSMGKGDENVGVLADTPDMIKAILNNYTRCEMPIVGSMTRRY